MADRTIMNAKDAVSASLAECFVTIGDNRYNFMQAINLEGAISSSAAAHNRPQKIRFMRVPPVIFCKQCTRKNSALQISPHLLYCRRWMP